MFWCLRPERLDGVHGLLCSLTLYVKSCPQHLSCLFEMRIRQEDDDPPCSEGFLPTPGLQTEVLIG